MRGICVHQLMSPKRVRSFRRVREEETSLMIENIRRLLFVSGSDSVIANLSDVSALLTNDVLCQLAMADHRRRVLETMLSRLSSL
ncbi:hypothetical protein ACP275_11G089200 [Erythranthe tilingii]